MNDSLAIATSNAAGFPILSLITWLPLIGCPGHHDGAWRRADRRLQRPLDRVVDQPAGASILSLVLWVKFDHLGRGFPVQRAGYLAAGIQGRLQHGRRRDLGPVRAAVHRADADLHPVEPGRRSTPASANS